MALKKYKPYTPSRRTMMWYDFSNITTNKPHKPLTKFIGKTWGRNNAWRITSRFMWWGHKRLYRIIDFRGYDKLDVIWTVATIEYDPYRTCRIALINYADWEKRYVLARNWIKVWDKISNGKNWEIKDGNRKQLKDIPDGYSIYCMEITPMTKGKFVRSAWAYATIQWRDLVAWLVIVKLQSSEVRKFNENCRASIGKVWNEDHMNVVIGKAGRSRRLGIKPHMLGKSMNPVDHPHGWWEWHTDIGLKKWAKAFNGRRVAPWIKTRSKKKRSTKFIVSRRTKN